MKKGRIAGSGWCVCCGESVGNRASEARYCWSCYKLVQKANTRLGLQTKQAISRGLLKPLVDQMCVDCGEPAKYYDHRSIIKPLDVEPVCHGCNVRRGPPSLTKELLEKYLALPTGLATGKPRGRPKSNQPAKKPPTMVQLGLKSLNIKRQMHRWAVMAKARSRYQIRRGVGSSDFKDVGGVTNAPVTRGRDRTRC